MPSRQINDFLQKRKQEKNELVARLNADPRPVAGVGRSQPDLPRASQVAELCLEKDGDIFVIGGLVIFSFGG